MGNRKVLMVSSHSDKLEAIDADWRNLYLIGFLIGRQIAIWTKKKSSNQSNKN